MQEKELENDSFFFFSFIEQICKYAVLGGAYRIVVWGEKDFGN